ncbi:MAG: hypothetical protein HFH28_04365, partial [Clostridiaceae bacterium]|nr:hypothetical protein [Clostridiaceae bacterium]
DAEGNAEGLRGQPEIQQHHRNHGCDEGNVPGRYGIGSYFRAVLIEWPSYEIPEKKKIAKVVIERVIVGDGSIEVIFRIAYGN